MSWGINRKNDPDCGLQFLQYNVCLYESEQQWAHSINQDLQLRTTIANYSNRCFLSQLIHRVTQFLRYFFLFGHTEWNNTKEQCSSLVAKNLTEAVSQILLRSDNPQFEAKIQQLIRTVGSQNQQTGNNNQDECNKLAARIVKQINVQGYVNKVMCDLLKINNANKSIPTNQLNYQLDALSGDKKLTKIIIAKEAKKIAQAFIAFYEPNKAQQATLLGDRNTFSHMRDLHTHLTFP